MSFTRRVAAVCALSAACAWSETPDPREIHLGYVLTADLANEHPIVRDPEIAGFLNGVLAALSRGQPLRVPLTLTVFETDDLVASSEPGGSMLLSTAAIAHAGSEAELAALVAHAMGHAQVGPPARRTTVASGTIPLVSAGGPWGFCSRVKDLMSLGSAPLKHLIEAQADLLGLGYLANAGYDPQAFLAAFDGWPGDGPDSEVRAHALSLAALRADSVVTTSGFERVKLRLAGQRRTAAGAPALQ